MESDANVREVLRRVLEALKTANVPYMLTGSFASAVHGAPRTTQDIDIVIAPSLGTLQALLRQFPDDAYYVSRDAAQAYGSEGLFNVIDFASGWKVDFIIRKSRPFGVEEFERRQQANILGTQITVASPEDVIISKLEWAKLSESERQLQDVAGILRLQANELDIAYVEGWVARLRLDEQWSSARAMAV